MDTKRGDVESGDSSGSGGILPLWLRSNWELGLARGSQYTLWSEMA